MYYAHFGLNEPPFKITPNTDFFYTGGNRGAVLDALKYAIDSGEGIIKVVGEVGSGKTMLCRMLQSQLPEKVESIYLANPSVAPEDILHAIAFELQLALPKEADRLKVMQMLQEHLLKRHAEGKQVVIFVEEAQGMPIETLEEIRLLSNLETRQDKLLQMVLFGQPELDENLNQNKIRQLRERITHSFYLAPFEKKDIGSYIDFRLRKAGYTGPPIFSPQALKVLSKASEGLVRRANILADKALLATFSENSYQVGYKHVMAAVKDSEFGREGKGKKYAQYAVYALLALLVLAATFLFYQNIQKVSLKAASKPVAQIKAPPKVNAELPPAAPLATQVTTIQESVIQATIPPDSPKSVVSASPQEVHSVTPALPTVESKADASIVPADDLLNAKLALTQEWFAQKPTTTATIQLIGVANDDQLREQLKQLKNMLDLNELYVYRTVVGGNPFITVTYGSYNDKSEALAAIEQLPESLKVYGPRVRTIGGILKEIKPLQ